MTADVSGPSTTLRRHFRDSRHNRRSPRNDGTLKEIQALRAIAVGVVVVFHVWPSALPGGFIGVDIFFVISGYLIGAHLLREAENTGRVALTWFWVRRIRRILPASFVVLIAGLLIMFAVVPRTLWPDTFEQVAGSVTYVVNWVLAAQSVDYLAAESPPTIVQHFWSLSVEEQFYIFLPIILTVALWLIGRNGRASSALRTRRLFATVVVALSVVSFAYALWLTVYAPSLAYFSTLARAWEFGAGVSLAAVTALAPGTVRMLREHPVLGRARLLTAVGLVLIAWSTINVSGDSLFPAPIALIPVAGVLLVIIGGFTPSRSIGAVMGARPVQFIGDVSYSTYLWHWLLLTWFWSAFALEAGFVSGLLIICATLIAAWLSKTLIEDPCRRAAIFNRRRWPAYALALGGAALIVALVAVLSVATAPKPVIVAPITPSAGGTAQPASCVGAAALLSGSDCADPFGLPASVDLAAAAADLDTNGWCLTWFNEEWKTCEIGSQDADRAGIVALVGDSYAASYTDAFDEYFREAGWGVETFTRFGCAGLGYPKSDAVVANRGDQQDVDCRAWSERVRDELTSRTDISAVVFIGRAPGDQGNGITPEEIERTWDSLIASGKEVIDVRTSPDLAVGNVPTCLTQNQDDPLECARPRSEVVLSSPIDVALAAVGDTVRHIDITDAFCDEVLCYPVIGGVVVYADERHVSTAYSKTVVDFLGPQLLSAFVPRGSDG